MKHVFIGCTCALGWLALLTSCTHSTIPDAAMLDNYQEQIRQQAQPEFNQLDLARANGSLSQADYDAERARLEKRIHNEARDLAFARHNLAQSELKSMGIPTPDSPVTNIAPNPLIGGGAAGGLGGASLYRPFSQQAQGSANQNFSGNILPTFQNYNNAGSLYSQPSGRY